MGHKCCWIHCFDMICIDSWPFKKIRSILELGLSIRRESLYFNRMYGSRAAATETLLVTLQCLVSCVPVELTSDSKQYFDSNAALVLRMV